VFSDELIVPRTEIHAGLTGITVGQQGADLACGRLAALGKRVRGIERTGKAISSLAVKPYGSPWHAVEVDCS